MRARLASLRQRDRESRGPFTGFYSVGSFMLNSYCAKHWKVDAVLSNEKAVIHPIHLPAVKTLLANGRFARKRAAQPSPQRPSGQGRIQPFLPRGTFQAPSRCARHWTDDTLMSNGRLLVVQKLSPCATTRAVTEIMSYPTNCIGSPSSRFSSCSRTTCRERPKLYRYSP